MCWIDHIIERRGGSMTFRDFMDLALYHPTKGYYSTGPPRYGRGGDFMTAPTASEWYGRVLADMLHRMTRRHGPVAFVDVGSGDGSLIATLISELEVSAQSDVEWMSVERSSKMRAVQRERFGSAHVSIGIVESIDSLPASGEPRVVHASELYDAMPVHRVVQREEGLRELCVAVDDRRRSWIERDAGDELSRYFEDHGVTLVAGQIAEVNLEARSHHRRLLAAIGEDGLLLLLDYGYPAARLYNPRGRYGGALACYRKHGLERDPLAEPGRRDMTAHVNWDDLRRVAEEEGWREIGLWPLAEFLVRAGLEDVLEREALGIEADLDAETVAARQEIKRLLDPDGMGSDLKMLVQGHGSLGEIADTVMAVRS